MEAKGSLLRLLWPEIVSLLKHNAMAAAAALASDEELGSSPSICRMPARRSSSHAALGGPVCLRRRSRDPQAANCSDLHQFN